jgi:plastocyanin
MMWAVSIAATARVLVPVLAGWGGSKKSKKGESEGKKMTIAGLSGNDHGSKQVSGTAEVELDDFYFDPTVLKGKPGAKVTLTLKNEGKVKHNFDLDAQNMDQDIDPGKSAAVTIPKSGQLSFFCKYHKSMGMAGALAASG